MSVPFFANEPSVLFDKYYVTELFPTTDMTYEQKMNAVARLVILLSLIGFLVTMKPRIFNNWDCDISSYVYVAKKK